MLYPTVRFSSYCHEFSLSCRELSLFSDEFSLFCHGFVYVAATLIILSWFCFSCHELWTTIGEAFNKLQLRGVSLSILLIKITKILCLSSNSINYIGQESRKLCAAGTSRIRKLSCFRSISKIGILQFGNT